MTTSEPELEQRRLRAERDLYLGLLSLNDSTELESFLERALELVLGSVAAAQGYLEIFDEEGEGWFTTAGYSEDEVSEVRSLVSRGIISETVAKGEAVVTPSALLDPRFRDLGSVRRSKIEAVLCAPIGSDPPMGVLYLQGSREGRPFGAPDLALAETFSRHLAPLLHQLHDRVERSGDDPTHAFRVVLDVGHIVGQSAALGGLLKEVALVAPLDVSVLITGETGTGKSQIARAIHNNSPRHHGPFIELNCATIPEPLMESELFGALAGSHSAASKRMDGKVLAADGGTLVLDEIAELSVSAQAKLLQLLQTKDYYPLGASKASSADIRLIAATNVDLRAAVDERRFREDLFYRLQVLPIRVPSLDERREDVELLARHFCTMAQQTHKLRTLQLSRGALRAIRAAEWPGNVRELAHFVEAGTIRAAGEGASQVEAGHLFGGPLEAPRESETALTFQEETRRFQKELLASTLESTGWNIAAASRQLDLTRSHVYNLIKAFGLERRT